MILRPSGDQFGSSSTVAVRSIVRFRGAAALLIRSSTLTVKMSLSSVAEPGNGLIGSPAPEADAWNAMFFDVPPFGPGGDQVGEPPRVRNRTSVPSWFIRNRSEVLTGSPAARSRLLSKTTFPLPSGESVGKMSV